MSTNTSQVPKAILLKNIPIILKKQQFVLSNDKLINISHAVYQEDVIYQSKVGDFLHGEGLGVTILNKLNRLTNSSITIAKYPNNPIERTSERVSNLIGRKNYETVFTALCSVISQELKVRGIYALLTINKNKDSSTQTTEPTSQPIKTYKDSSSQTEVSCIPLKRTKPKRRLKRQALVPYVAKTVEKQKKKIIVHPKDFKSDGLMDLKETGLDFIGENSNDSVGNLSALSVTTTKTLLYNPTSLIDNVDKYTQQHTVVEQQETPPEEMPVVLLPKVDKVTINSPARQTPLEAKLQANTQALIDFKNCMVPDEDGNLPIHDAVMTNDVDLLLRQCLALTARKKSVDQVANGQWTPLKMAILKNLSKMTSILLRFGANPLLTDSDHKTSIHHAAEMPHAHLKAIVDYCMKKPRTILEQNDELWQDKYDEMQDDRLARLLLGTMCSMCDSDGYTPLMLASKMGISANVEMLIRIAPTTINKQMPTSGSTALYLSVGSACNDCVERADKSVISPNFRNTIELLVEHGSDPSITNHSGNNVNILLTEFNIPPLSTLVASKLTSLNCFNGFMPDNSKGFDSYMLVKGREGLINVIEMDKKIVPAAPIQYRKRPKPVIVEDILITPGHSKRHKPDDTKKFQNSFKEFVDSKKEGESPVDGGITAAKQITLPVKKRTRIARKSK